jgi:hypothetical protein
MQQWIDEENELLANICIIEEEVFVWAGLWGREIFFMFGFFINFTFLGGEMLSFGLVGGRKRAVGVAVRIPVLTMITIQIQRQHISSTTTTITTRRTATTTARRV